MAGRCVVRNHVLVIEAEDADVVLGVQDNQLVGTELNGSNGSGPGRSEGHVDTLLSIDIDDASAELGFIRANGQEGLDGIVGKDGDLRIDAIASELETVSGMLRQGEPKSPATHLIQHEYLGRHTY